MLRGPDDYGASAQEADTLYDALQNARHIFDRHATLQRTQDEKCCTHGN